MIWNLTGCLILQHPVMMKPSFGISTNPGQPVRPLMEVASGGELSCIMLAIKTVLADSDDIPTLIFDEIDTGISGRTAQKVSEKLLYCKKPSGDLYHTSASGSRQWQILI